MIAHVEACFVQSLANAKPQPVKSDQSKWHLFAPAILALPRRVSWSHFATHLPTGPKTITGIPPALLGSVS